jgi:hypothetical protein
MAQQVKNVGISDALKFFDSLPDSASVRLPVVAALKACSSVLAAAYIRRNLAALNGGGIWRRRERCDVNETGARRPPES